MLAKWPLDPSYLSIYLTQDPIIYSFVGQLVVELLTLRYLVTLLESFDLIWFHPPFSFFATQSCPKPSPTITAMSIGETPSRRP